MFAETKVSSDFTHLEGYNFSTNIEAIYVTVPLRLYPDMTQYDVCEYKNTVYLNKQYLCLKKYENLSIKKFKNKDDYIKYGLDIYQNRFIVQGLTTHRNSNFLVTAYYKTTDSNENEKPSIIINYDPDTDEIVKIYDLNPSDFNSQHVGGIGFHFIKYPSTQNPQISYYYDMVFVSDSGSPYSIKIFRMTETALTLIKTVNVQTKPSYLSISNGYLWYGNYEEDEEDNAKYLEGVKISASYFYAILNLSLGKGVDSSNNLIPNIFVKTNTTFLQGVYCDSNPDVDKRLNFYFVASGLYLYASLTNRTFVYQATLNIKDLDNNGRIDNNSEYYWESFFSPHDPRAYSKEQLLPDGGEGIVKRGDNLYMLNEGASKYYLDKWSNYTQWVDGAREILMIDPIKKSENIYVPMFHNGSIYLQGKNLNNFGHKVVLFLAQNKKGELYYTWAEYMYRDDVHFRDVYFYKMPTYNKYPTGFQPPHNIIHPMANVEDVKAMFIMNLDEKDEEGDSDNWNLDLINIIFDDTEFISPQYTYDVKFDLNNPFLGNLSNGETNSGIIISFNTVHGDSNNMETKIVASYFNMFELNRLRDMLNDCYQEYGNECLINPAYYLDIISYFENVPLCSLLNHPYFNINNSSLGRLNNITSGLCE
ncbi:hypothetical protein JXR93_01815 [bacterium]|nr:hypothetical protein [bacterium]